MAREVSILQRLQAGLATLEAELKTDLENVGWKRTNGQESRIITAKRAAIEEKKEAITAKQKDVAKYQAFFEYIDKTDRHIAELEDAAAGRRISPRIQAQIDADWEAKKADIKRAYEEYEESLKV
jgi:pyruvate-formate lyase